jgi:hypothetical protein
MTVRRWWAVAGFTTATRAAWFGLVFPMVGVGAFTWLFASAGMPSLAEGEFVPSDPMEALVALANTSDVYVWVAMIVSIGALVGAIAGPVFGALQIAPEAGGATVVAEAVWGDSAPRRARIRD